jgi:polar amino acid transport system substrate-binding protein
LFFQPRMRSVKLMLRFILFLLFIFPYSGHSQTSRMIMVTEEWPPFRIINKNSSSGYSGIDIDIIKQLSIDLGVTIEIKHYPWARALELMKSGQADIISGIALTPEREKFLYYVPVSYYAVHPVFYTRKGKGKMIRTYENLYGSSVGYSLNSFYFEPFNSDTQIKKRGFSTEAQLLKILAMGRIDVIIGTDPNISYEIARMGYRDLMEPTVFLPAEKTELFIAISRKSPAITFAGKIEEILQHLKDDGRINEIMNSYNQVMR